MVEDLNAAERRGIALPRRAWERGGESGSRARVLLAPVFGDPRNWQQVVSDVAPPASADAIGAEGGKEVLQSAAMRVAVPAVEHDFVWTGTAGERHNAGSLGQF